MISRCMVPYKRSRIRQAAEMSAAYSENLPRLSAYELFRAGSPSTMKKYQNTGERQLRTKGGREKADGFPRHMRLTARYRISRLEKYTAVPIRVWSLSGVSHLI